MFPADPPLLHISKIQQATANVMLFVYICMQARPFLSYREKAASEKKAEAAMDVFDWMETDIYRKCAVRDLYR